MKYEDKFPERLTYAMTKRHINAKSLAERLGIHTSAICNYRFDRYRPKKDRLLAIAEILEVDPDWLMGFDVPMSETESEINPEDYDKYLDISTPLGDVRSLTQGERNLILLYRNASNRDKKIVALILNNSTEPFETSQDT